MCFVAVVHAEFISEAKVIMEGEARSTSSFPYDDIDEAVEARPLTSQAATAGASGQNYFFEEGVLDHSTGKFCTCLITSFSH